MNKYIKGTKIQLQLLIKNVKIWKIYDINQYFITNVCNFKVLTVFWLATVSNSTSQSAPRQGSSSPIGPPLRAAEADMRQWWEPGGELRSWNEARTRRKGSHRAVPCGSGRGSAPLKLKAAPAEWRAPSMRRLALILLPCAVAVLVHLWLAQRPSTTPLDNNTHSGTFFYFCSHAARASTPFKGSQLLYLRASAWLTLPLPPRCGPPLWLLVCVWTGS